MSTTMVYGKRRHAETLELPKEIKKQKIFSLEANSFFAQIGIKIEELNKLDVSKNPRCKGCDYVDFIKPGDMTAGMMSFNAEGKEGVALLITGNGMVDVMTIFQRYAFKKNWWASAYRGLGNQMMDVFFERHKKEVQHKHGLQCPGNSPCSVPIPELIKVIQGEDPEFKIGTPPKQDDIKMEM